MSYLYCHVFFSSILIKENALHKPLSSLFLTSTTINKINTDEYLNSFNPNYVFLLIFCLF